MSEKDPVRNGTRGALLRNWLSLAGLVIAIGSLFSFLLLFILDSATHLANPYIGILTYLVAPRFLITGLFLAPLGALSSSPVEAPGADNQRHLWRAGQSPRV